MSQVTQITALKIAEEFMSGFKGDEMQEGIDEKLSTIRAATALEETAPDELQASVPDDIAEAPEPLEFTINVAMDVRAYGYVKVTDMTLDEALKQCTPRFIADNFEPNGSGSDDLDCTNPVSIYLSDATWYDHADQPQEAYVEFNLPDDANLAGYTGITIADAQLILSAWSGLENLSPEEKTLQEHLSAFVATKTAS